MNRLEGVIAAVQSNSHLSLVDVAVGEDTFTALLLETPETTGYLAPGSPVELLFKATEVALAKNLTGTISMRNRFTVTVKAIRRGSLISEVLLDYHGHTLSSAITTRAIDRLGLAVGEAVEALVKSNEMTVAQRNTDSTKMGEGA